MYVNKINKSVSTCKWKINGHDWLSLPPPRDQCHCLKCVSPFLFLTHPHHLPRALTEKINKKNKHANVKPFMVKNHLWVFLSCNIENPAFDSQVRVCVCFACVRECVCRLCVKVVLL